MSKSDPLAITNEHTLIRPGWLVSFWNKNTAAFGQEEWTHAYLQPKAGWSQPRFKVKSTTELMELERLLAESFTEGTKAKAKQIRKALGVEER